MYLLMNAPQPYVIQFDDGRAKNLDLSGGKGASLAELSQIPEINIPLGIIVTTHAYHDFVIKNNLLNIIEKLEKPYTPKQVRKAFLAGKIPDEISSAIIEGYKNLKKCCRKNCSVAVRSSATAEDLPKASFAGQHDSFLNQKSSEEVVNSVKKCWSSIFTDRAVEYRKRRNFPHSKVNLAVIVQKMVPAFAAGVGYTIDVSNYYEGIKINVNYGLGESLVGGNINADSYVVNPHNFEIIKSRLGDKSQKVVFDNNKGTVYVNVPVNDRKKYVLDISIIKKIASQIKKIAEHYSKIWPYIDVEFAVDKKKNIYFVQCRPETSWEMGLEKVLMVDENHVRNAKIIIEGGIIGSRGAAHGKLKIFENINNLIKCRTELTNDNVLICESTNFRWTKYIQRVAAVATNVGDESCHAAIVSRESGIPCIINLGDATKVLKKYEGLDVTVDAHNKRIYLGRLPLKKGIVKPASWQLKGEDKETLEKAFEGAMNANVAVIDHEGRWIKKPPFYTTGFQLELFQKTWEQIEKRYKMQVRRKVMKDGLYTNFEDNFAIQLKFRNMEIDELYKVAEKRDNATTEFSESCQSFECTPAALKRFIQAFKDFQESIWNGWAFYKVSQGLLEKKIMEKQVPPEYRNEIFAQMTLGRTTLTTERGREYTKLLEKARKLLPNLDDSQLKKQIYEYAIGYRIGIDSNIRDPPPIKKVLEQLRKDIQRENLVFDPVKLKYDPALEFYPEDPKFQKIMHMTGLNSILKENCHHVIARGQFRIREKLIEFANKHPNNRILKGRDIFKLSLLDLKNIFLGLNTKK